MLVQHTAENASKTRFAAWLEIHTLLSGLHSPSAALKGLRGSKCVSHLQRTITDVKVMKGSAQGETAELQNNPGGPSFPVSGIAMEQPGKP